jgi:hypothetical protein
METAATTDRMRDKRKIGFIAPYSHTTARMAVLFSLAENARPSRSPIAGIRLVPVPLVALSPRLPVPLSSYGLVISTW